MTNDEEQYGCYSMEELFTELRHFIADKNSEKFMLTKFQAHLICEEIIGLCNHIIEVDADEQKGSNDTPWVIPKFKFQIFL